MPRWRSTIHTWAPRPLGTELGAPPIRPLRRLVRREASLLICRDRPRAAERAKPVHGDGRDDRGPELVGPGRGNAAPDGLVQEVADHRRPAEQHAPLYRRLEGRCDPERRSDGSGPRSGPRATLAARLRNLLAQIENQRRCPSSPKQFALPGCRGAPEPNVEPTKSASGDRNVKAPEELRGSADVEGHPLLVVTASCPRGNGDAATPSGGAPRSIRERSWRRRWRSRCCRIAWRGDGIGSCRNIY